MPSLAWSADLDNNLAPMDETHREFVECYNVAGQRRARDFLRRARRASSSTRRAHFDLENGWMEAVDFPGCHRAEHDRVLAVMADIRKRVERGDHFLRRRLMEELPAWFVNHVNGMDAALAFHLATIGFDVDSACTLRPLAEGETRAAGCGCATLAAEDAEPARPRVRHEAARSRRVPAAERIAGRGGQLPPPRGKETPPPAARRSSTPRAWPPSRRPASIPACRGRC